MRISDWSSDVCSSDLSSALWVDVARFREANADTLGARDAVDYAIELDKANSAALAFKANLVRGRQGLEASLSWYADALAADPDNADALIDQAATLGDLGRYRDMLAALRHAATIVPRDPRSSEEHTSELQSLMRTSYAVFCLKKKK